MFEFMTFLPALCRGCVQAVRSSTIAGTICCPHLYNLGKKAKHLVQDGQNWCKKRSLCDQPS